MALSKGSQKRNQSPINLLLPSSNNKSNVLNDFAAFLFFCWSRSPHTDTHIGCFDDFALENFHLASEIQFTFARFFVALASVDLAFFFFFFSPFVTDKISFTFLISFSFCVGGKRNSHFMDLVGNISPQNYREIWCGAKKVYFHRNQHTTT